MDSDQSSTVSDSLDAMDPVCEDVYLTKFGSKIKRTGKIFSCTFWRTQIEEDIFWSMQWQCENGTGTWVTTQYFGPAHQSGKYQQQVTLVHPTEKKIKMRYWASCCDGGNNIFISKTMMNHFRDKDNAFNFEFRIIRSKRKPNRNF